MNSLARNWSLWINVGRGNKVNDFTQIGTFLGLPGVKCNSSTAFRLFLQAQFALDVRLVPALFEHIFDVNELNNEKLWA